MKNLVVVVKDYDGFFEREAQRVAEQLPQMGLTIQVTAGPYRPYDVHYHVRKNEKIVELDYYAAVRNGFGNPHTDEVIAELIISLS